MALPVGADFDPAPPPISGFGGRFVRAAHKRRGVAFGLTQRIDLSVQGPMEGSFAAFRASRADFEDNDALARVAAEAKVASRAAAAAVMEDTKEEGKIIEEGKQVDDEKTEEKEPSSSSQDTPPPPSKDTPSPARISEQKRVDHGRDEKSDVNVNEETSAPKSFIRQQIEDFVVERGIEWLHQELRDRGLSAEGPRLRLVKLLEKSYLREREREHEMLKRMKEEQVQQKREAKEAAEQEEIERAKEHRAAVVGRKVEAKRLRAREAARLQQEREIEEGRTMAAEDALSAALRNDERQAHVVR